MEKVKRNKLNQPRNETQIFFSFVFLADVWNTKGDNRICEEEMHQLHTLALGEKVLSFSIKSTGKDVENFLSW